MTSIVGTDRASSVLKGASDDWCKVIDLMVATGITPRSDSTDASSTSTVAKGEQSPVATPKASTTSAKPVDIRPKPLDGTMTNHLSSHLSYGGSSKDGKHVHQEPVSQNSSSTTKENLMNLKNLSIEALLGLAFGACVFLFLFYTAIDHMSYAGAESRREHQSKEDVRAEQHSHSMVIVATNEATVNAINKKAELPVTASPVSSGPEYDCNSSESVQAGFRKGTAHTLEGSATFLISGCGWYIPAQKVSAIVGSGFIIELPDDPNRTQDSDMYKKSPSAAYPDPVAFWNQFKDSRYPFRVLTLKGGHVAITTMEGE